MTLGLSLLPAFVKTKALASFRCAIVRRLVATKYRNAPTSGRSPIPDRAEHPHAPAKARSGPSFKSPSLRAIAPGVASSQLSTTDHQRSLVTGH